MIAICVLISIAWIVLVLSYWNMRRKAIWWKDATLELMEIFGELSGSETGVDRNKARHKFIEFGSTIQKELQKDVQS